ncbi:hypothetical protein Sjap_017067 [Stephania japonica]|uniref:Uncharacterized protein n=1 Tax=Stephania japonica TaxID=461633 RepID=A0AAP0I5F9_9MAGN
MAVTRKHVQVEQILGHVAVYVGEAQMKRFLIPFACLRHPSFQDLLNRVEEEFGFDHSMGGLQYRAMKMPSSGLLIV